MAFTPRFSITPGILAAVEEIAALREKIQAATVEVAWIPALQKDSRVRNTHSSTAIEGNPLTLEQVRALEEGMPLPAVAERSRREVLNYFAGLRWMERHVRKKSVTHADILKIHAVVASGAMDQGRSGRYRDIAVRAGRHLPPPPEQVSRLMTEFLAWWNADSSRWSPVITSAVVHFRFEDIHPFADGNGRVGRMLAMWELYRRGFDTHHIFSVDEFYWEDRSRYYRELDAVRARSGDLTGWLAYVAEGLLVTLEKVWLRIQRLAADTRKQKIVLRPKQEQLLQMLRDRGGLTPREIWDGIGISKQGAMDLLKPLLKAGMVRRTGSRKSGRYILG